MFGIAKDCGLINDPSDFSNGCTRIPDTQFCGWDDDDDPENDYDNEDREVDIENILDDFVDDMADHNRSEENGWFYDDED